MTFEELLDQAIDLLRRRGRVTYRALKLHFHLDDDTLEVLKDELLYGQQRAVEADDKGLVWTGRPRCGARHPPAGRGRAPAPHHGPGGDGAAPAREAGHLPRPVLCLRRGRGVPARGAGRAALPPAGARGGRPGLVWTGEDAPPVVSASHPAPAPAMALSVVSPRPPLPPPEAPQPLPEPLPALDGVSSLPVDDVVSHPPADVPVLTPAVAHSGPEAERRQLTVLFCDLVGSTQLSGQLDPEDLRAVVRAYQETAAEVIQHYEGHIAQYLGDGLLVYFGYPVAHEDDARRAVHTGLGIVQAIATLNTRLAAQYHVQLAVRLGIHTGPVVVGAMGGGGRHEHLALGETPNIAARLEGLAPANAVVISAVTARLAQGTFALEDLGAHALHGVAEPMACAVYVACERPPAATRSL